MIRNTNSIRFPIPDAFPSTIRISLRVTGTATGTTEGADAHIDRLAKKYLDADSYPFRREGEQRITFLVDATRVFHQKQR